MKKTKIVCTLGPASESKDVFRQMVLSGLNVVRLNFSHGSHEEHQKRIDLIKEVRRELGLPVSILIDLKGPEIRTGKFSSPNYVIEEGQIFTLTSREVLGDKTICSVSYKGLPNDVKVGDRILIDDGLVELEVVEIKERADILCRVLNRGIISANKGINIPGVYLNLPAVTSKDRADIEFAIKNDIDFIAASFVRKTEDVLAIKEILEENEGNHIAVISKIENREGVNNLKSIIAVSDAIMIARGDLGVEIPAEELPMVQKTIIKKCNKVGKAVITATQMLDSMIRNPRPTRAEVSDVANAIIDGTDAVMLSGETAIGNYPVETVKTMSNIAVRTEMDVNYRKHIQRNHNDTSITDAISSATCSIAMDLNASAIITATTSGHTARMVSKFWPSQIIVAATSDERVQRRLTLSRGVYPILKPFQDSTDEMINCSIKKALEADLIKHGDLVVITAGVPVGIQGTTNLIKAHIVSEVLASGTGIGKSTVSGRVHIVKDDLDLNNDFIEGDILVAREVGENLLPIIEKSSAIITENGGLNSYAATVGVNLDKPTLVGVKGIIEKVKEGDVITVDAASGQIYSGSKKIL
jgi:pyruvate kinase